MFDVLIPGHKFLDVFNLLNGALVLHIPLARRNKAFIHAGIMGQFSTVLYVMVFSRCLYDFCQSECQENGHNHL